MSNQQKDQSGQPLTWAAFQNLMSNYPIGDESPVMLIQGPMDEPLNVDGLVFNENNNTCSIIVGEINTDIEGLGYTNEVQAPDAQQSSVGELVGAKGGESTEGAEDSTENHSVGLTNQHHAERIKK